MGEPSTEIIAANLERLVARLRATGVARLTRTNDQLEGLSLAEAAYLLSNWCVQTHQHLTNTHMPALPRLEPLAAGDQLWVTGYELLAVLAMLAGQPNARRSRAEFLDRINVIRKVG